MNLSYVYFFLFSLTFTFIQVSICNVVRGVMEGKAFVSIIADILEDADIATIKFLVKVSKNLLYLTHYHTIPHFDALKIYSGRKHCEERRNCL